MKAAILLALTAALGVNGLLWDACSLADRHIDEGYELAADERYNEAIAEYDKAVSIAPNNYDAYFYRGNAYFDIGEYDKAIADYSKAIELDSNDSYSYYNRGLAYRLKGEYERALQDYDRVLIIEPDAADAHASKGACYILQDDYPKAIASYDKAISLDKYNPDLYYIRGLSHAELGDVPNARRDYEEALEIYEAREQWSEAREVKRALERLNETALVAAPDAIGAAGGPGVYAPGLPRTILTRRWFDAAKPSRPLRTPLFVPSSALIPSIARSVSQSDSSNFARQPSTTLRRKQVSHHHESHTRNFNEYANDKTACNPPFHREQAEAY